jgi:hypothetical protein
MNLFTTVSTTRKKAASGRFYTSPPENIGITESKAFIAASISMGVVTLAKYGHLLTTGF